MSFRTRLSSFFILIVVVPMIAVAFLVFRLISDSEQGKADARANGVLGAATSLYQTESVAASGDARAIARELSTVVAGGPVSARAIRSLGIDFGPSVRAGAGGRVSVGSRVLADVGSRNAIAPGAARVSGHRLNVLVSEITASAVRAPTRRPRRGGRRARGVPRAGVTGLPRSAARATAQHRLGEQSTAPAIAPSASACPGSAPAE